jgi:NAD(P)-dependent dehydrogenase (short-subunit alcohol dehydrogenase family)
MRLSGKVALITGAGNGIGRASARLFAAEGAKVAVLDRLEAEGRRTVAEIEQAGGAALFVPADVTNEAQVRRAVEATVERFGALHILYANAGVSPAERGPIEELTRADWDRILNVNLNGVFVCMQQAVPAIRRAAGGAIVATASAAALVARGTLSYSAAKGGVIALMRTLAIQLAPAGIRVNAVAPGFINNFMPRAGRLPTEEERRQRLADMAAQTPLGRPGTPEDIAHAALYLASDDASFVTGQVLVVDGGLTAL